MLEDNQIYIIVDIELNGKIPGEYSMLSLGAVASTMDQEVGSFYKKFLPLEELSADPETMAWWKTQPEAWQEVTTAAEPAAAVIAAFREWVGSFGKSPVFVASPLILDYPFVKWYLHKFGGEQLFENFGQAPRQRTLDLASFTAGKLNIPLAQARRVQLPPEITQGMPEHSHKAIDDARGYGVILRNVLKAETAKDFRLYRFSPIKNKAELLEAIKYVHFACNKLCKQSFGEYLPNAGNLGIFCHYDDEYDRLVALRKEMTEESDNVNQKYFRLHEPIIISAEGDVPEATYTHLYIRKPDPYRHHVGDVDFYLKPDEYKELKQAMQDGKIVKGARIFPRQDLDMIELYDPDVDACGYVSTHQMAATARVKQSKETNL